MHWRLRWEQHGPQAMLSDVLAQQAPRLLAQADGERALTHLLHLGELMQQARAAAFDTRGLGPRGQIDWLQAAIAHADPGDEAQWPRLESDAGRVQILTLHESKGLEFPLVFLPFAGIGRKDAVRGEVVDYHDDAGVRVRQWKTEYAHPSPLVGEGQAAEGGSEPAPAKAGGEGRGNAPDWVEACRRARVEDQAEDMRLLYVGLTRARDALWLCGGAFANHRNTALFRLLGAQMRRTQQLRTRLDGLLDLHEGLPTAAPRASAAATAATGSRRTYPCAHAAPRLVDPQLQPAPPPAPARHPGAGRRSAGRRRAPAGRTATRRPCASAAPASATSCTRRWNTSTSRAGATATARRCPTANGRTSSRHCATRTTPNRTSPTARASWRRWSRARSTPRFRLRPQPKTTRRRACATSRPKRASPNSNSTSPSPAPTPARCSRCCTHTASPCRAATSAPGRGCRGLMNGKIDLTYRLDGRAYVLDYKSNRLPAYDDATLAQAMAASEYDLQALLYVVALHRWLRLRRGATYDYARDFGGVRYLFCRGLAPDSTQGHRAARLPARTGRSASTRCSHRRRRMSRATDRDRRTARGRRRVRRAAAAARSRHRRARAAGGAARAAGGGAGPCRARPARSRAARGHRRRCRGAARSIARVALGRRARGRCRRRPAGGAAGAARPAALPAPLPRVRAPPRRRPAPDRRAAAVAGDLAALAPLFAQLFPKRESRRRPGPRRRAGAGALAAAGHRRPRHRQDHHASRAC